MTQRGKRNVAKTAFEPLAKTHPELAAQWHPTKNGNVTPNDVKANNCWEIWWVCPKGHEWRARPWHRTHQGNACPFCAGKKFTREDSLAGRHPTIAAELHPTKNGEATPDQLFHRSTKNFWWRCAKNPAHEWRTTVVRRTEQGSGCPYCSGRLLTPENSFGGRFPKLAAQWHPTKNGDTKPTDFAAASQLVAWWQCPSVENHSWKSKVRSRAQNPDLGCPLCARITSNARVRKPLGETHPQLLKEWHPTRNSGVSPADVHAGSSGKLGKIWWRCVTNPSHEWQSSVANRAWRGNGCPFCAGQYADATNSLAVLFPKLAAEWHPTKNGERTPHNVTPGSARKVWWRCANNPEHEWEARIQPRAKRGNGCPFCSSWTLTRERSLAVASPPLAAEWHPTKNAGLTPRDITVGSARKVWWQCSQNPAHEWKTSPKNRSVLMNGCPLCKVGWTVPAIRGFIDSLKHHLSTFTPAELYVLFQQNGLLSGDRKSRAFVEALATGRFPFEEIEKFCKGQKSLVDSFLKDSSLTLEGLATGEQSADAAGATEGELGVVPEAGEESAELPKVETKEVLASLQAAVVVSADQEAIEFLVASALAKIWRHAFRDEVAAVAQAEAFAGDAYAERVRTDFLADYERVKQLPVPPGYAFKVEGRLTLPNLMQRLVAARIQHQRRVGNWSGTGAGKTLSAVLASRVVGARLTVICCPNSVVTGWREAILNAFPDSLVATKTFEPDWATIAGDETGFGKAAASRYLVLNYEAFQQEDSEGKVQRFAAREGIDFVVVDEIHFTKQRSVENLSQRKRLVTALISLAGAKNPGLCVLGMSATPVINNLQEGKSLVEMVSGLAHEELNTRPTVPNCMKLHQRLVALGTRWVPDYQIVCDVQMPEVDCAAAVEEIRALGRGGSPLQLEQILTRVRLPIIRREMRAKTLLYTHYLQGIERELYDALTADGWRVGFFTGDDKSGLDGFLHGDVDVLIGSSAIGTGVDGLQAVCQRLVVNVLPWTHAEFEQLKGRIFRQGQHAEKVTVVIPVTYADVNGERWSWCESKLRRLHFKKSIADAAVDGVVPEGHLRSPAQAFQDVMGWLGRLSKGEVEVISRARIVVPLSQDNRAEVERRARTYGDFSAMNRTWNQSRSATTFERLQKNPEEWAQYHTLYREARKGWAVVPFEEFVRWAKQRSDYVIGDFGCGEAKVAEALADRHTVYSFDHVGANDDVIACDMAKVPLEDGCLDVALFSLSLMGANFADYLREAWRLLKLDGQLHIFEATSRFTNRDVFVGGLKKLGFAVVEVRDLWKFTHIHALRTDRAPDAQATLEF